eukprot:gene7780-25666_t
MSGRWGIGLRIGVDFKGYFPGLDYYNVDALVGSFLRIPGNPAWIIINLSDAAHGDAYAAPHSVLDAMFPVGTCDGCVKTSPFNNDGHYFGNRGRDLFGEILVKFKAKGIKVIAYMATQGPAMLKHGCKSSFDKVGNCQSAIMTKWKAHVQTTYGVDPEADCARAANNGGSRGTCAAYKKAYAEIIVKEFAQRYNSFGDSKAQLDGKCLCFSI